MSPERRRRAVTLLQRRFGVSERRACQVASQPRAVQRYIPTVRADEDALTQAIVAHAAEYGRYGYRRVTDLLIPRESGHQSSAESGALVGSALQILAKKVT